MKRIILFLLFAFLLSSCNKKEIVIEDDIPSSIIVDFDTSGPVISSQELDYGDKVIKPEDPKIEGYEFGGWYIDTKIEVEYDFDSLVYESFTLHAKWTKIFKTVQYELGNPQIERWTDSNINRMKISFSIKNTGISNLYLDSSMIDIRNKKGDFLQTKSSIIGSPEYIKPGEVGYYYTETERIFDEEDINLFIYPVIKEATNDILRYESYDISIVDDLEKGIILKGKIKNENIDYNQYIKIVSHLFDENDNLICICSNYLDDFSKESEYIEFELTPNYYKNFNSNSIARYEIFAYPTLFNWSYLHGE